MYIVYQTFMLSDSSWKMRLDDDCTLFKYIIYERYKNKIRKIIIITYYYTKKKYGMVIKNETITKIFKTYCFWYSNIAIYCTLVPHHVVWISFTLIYVINNYIEYFQLRVRVPTTYPVKCKHWTGKSGTSIRYFFIRSTETYTLLHTHTT